MEPSHFGNRNIDLHVYVDEHVRTMEFRVFSQGRTVCVDVRGETLSICFGVPNDPHGLLKAYETHRAEIDAAVIRRAAEAGEGVVMVRPMDLH